MLAKLGYTFDSKDLLQYEVDAYSIIATEFNKIESEEMKKKSKRK